MSTFTITEASESTSWRAHAHCRGADPGLWFNDAYYRRARLICFTCPVKDPCLEYAIVHDEVQGMWGGASERERRKMRRQRRREAST